MTKIKINKIQVLHKPDEFPDCSYLQNEYEVVDGKLHIISSGAGYTDKDITTVGQEELIKYFEQDAKRLRDLDNGYWYYIDITAVATISIQVSPSYSILQKIDSGGIWGIESDSGQDYIKDEENSQLEELKDILKALKVSQKEINRAFENIERP